MFNYSEKKKRFINIMEAALHENSAAVSVQCGRLDMPDEWSPILKLADKAAVDCPVLPSPDSHLPYPLAASHLISSR